MTTSARSTSSRSISSRRTSVSSRSNGPANTSRSSSRSAIRIVGRLLPGSDRSDPHRLANVDHRLGGDGARLLSPGGKNPLELTFVSPELLVALPNRGQILDHGVGHGLLEGAVAGAVERRLDLLRTRAPHRGQDVD